MNRSPSERFARSVLVALAIVSAPAAAAAADPAAADGHGASSQPATPAATPPSEIPTRWYGWQTLLADAVPLIVAPATLATTSGAGTMVPVVAGVYLLGAPAVHASHGRSGAAAASFGLRVGLPLGGALLGVMIATPGSRSCEGCIVSSPVLGAVIGGLVGVLAASVTDAAALGYEPDPKAAQSAFVVPTVSALPGGASAGVAGRF